MLDKIINKCKVGVILSLIIIYSCNTKHDNGIKVHNFRGIKLYEIHCNEKIYFSLEKGSCDSMPSSYLYPKGNSEHYFCLFVRTKDKKIELYSPYNELVKIGGVDNRLKIFEYRNYEDNIFIEDSIKGKTYTIDGTTSL